MFGSDSLVQNTKYDQVLHRHFSYIGLIRNCKRRPGGHGAILSMDFEKKSDGRERY